MGIIAAASVACAAGPAFAGNTTVNVSNAPAGKTLQYVGYNIAHYMPGSNTSAWMDYSGVNAARVWATSSDYETLSGSRRDDFAPWGDGVSDLAGFNSRKAALRNDPLNPAYINWARFNDKFDDVQTGRNKVVLNHVLGELHDRDIHVIQQTTRSAGAYEITGESDWAGKWEQWQHYYAMAFHSARNYDVSQFQMYNEPDADANTNQVDFNIRLKLAGDAIRSAVADVNQLYGKSLGADIAAPTTAGGSTKVDGSGGRNWGQTALQQIRTDYQGQTVNYDIFNTYSAQVYGQTGASFGTEVQNIRNKIPQYHAAGQQLPLIFTEFNRHTSNNFADMPESLETPYVFTDIASTYVNAMARGANSMYAFKFSQTMWVPSGSTAEEPQKTGFHYVANSGTYDVTGATHSSGVVRLVAKAFVDQRDRLTAGTATSINNYDLASSYDPASDNYYLFGVNRNDAETHTLRFNLNSWGIAPGTMVSVEEVSTGHNGEVVHMVPVGSDGTVTLNQPSRSVWLLTVPKTADAQLNLAASDDARVRNSDAASAEPYKTQNYGSLERARVGRTDSSARLDYATYLKFNVGNTDPDDVSRAILRLNGAATNADGGTAGTILFHVYALAGDTWNENSITWDNAPNLDDLDTKLTGVGTSAFPVGQLTFTGGGTQLVGIDLTKFLRDHPSLFDDGQLSFALIRETRFANDLDNPGSFVELYTSESVEGLGPQLTLFVPEPGPVAVIELAGTGLALRRRRRARGP